MQTKRFQLAGLATLALLILQGCGGGSSNTTVSNPDKVSALSIAPASVTVAPGKSRAFSYQIQGSGNPGLGVIWSVDEGAAGGTVDANGLYTAPGNVTTAHVTVSSQTNPAVKATAVVNVSPNGFQLTPKPGFENHFFTLTTAGQQDLNKVILVSGGATNTVTWKVESANGGTVSAANVYTAPGQTGTYLLSATSNDDPTQKDYYYAVVTGAASTPSAPTVILTISPTNPILPAGVMTMQFGYNIMVTGSLDNAVSWSVSPNTATITQAGIFTAPANTTGTDAVYTVTVTSHVDPKVTASTTVTVPKR